MIVGLLHGERCKDRRLLLVFYAVYLAGAVLAFSLKKKIVKRSLADPATVDLALADFGWCFSGRTARRALKGELQHWGVLNRTGT